MTNLPIWAEKLFSLKCSEGHATCTKPDEDIHGWDFLVELPEKAHIGAEERRPPIRTAYAQVKSTKAGKPRASIKLSNMLKACRSRDPWFIVLVAADKQGKNASLYAIHVWSDLMRKSLAAVREASIEGVPLNRRKISVNFPPDSKMSGDIVAWMQSTIDSSAPDYSNEKARISDTLGYEDGYGTGKLTIEAKSEEEIFRAFLGLGKGVTTKVFSYTHSRFGLPDPRPKI